MNLQSDTRCRCEDTTFEGAAGSSGSATTQGVSGVFSRSDELSISPSQTPVVSDMAAMDSKTWNDPSLFEQSCDEDASGQS
jgi:hypothetical protein